MPIEFSCAHCGKLLRTPDDSAGKQARCPACGAVGEIPPAGAIAASLAAEPRGYPPPPPNEPPRGAYTAGDAGNPYRAPLTSGVYIVHHGGVLASRVARLLAFWVDGLVALGFAFLAACFGAPAGAFRGGQLDSRNVLIIATAVPATLIFTAIQCYFLTTRGQSLGKMALGIRIVNHSDGGQADFMHVVVLRYLVPAILMWVPCFGFIDILWILGPERRCLHDLMAGTSVVNAK